MKGEGRRREGQREGGRRNGGQTERTSNNLGDELSRRLPLKSNPCLSVEQG